jgi:hypothetical protein
MKRLIAVVAIVVLGSGAMALATPGHGDIHRADLARGAHADGGTITFEGGTETVVFTFTMSPGSTSGWHRHPGAVVVLVKSGTLTTYGLDQPPCTGVDLPTGTAYFEDDASTAQWPHFVRNKSGTETVEAVVTAFNVPSGASARTESDAPQECDDPV